MISDSPLISIILPVCNSMRFLEERMDSIMKQSFSDWEVVAVDSFSNDGSFQYLQQLAEKDGRIKLYQTPRGLYQSWNFGIKKGRGKYIYIATSDDLMTVDCLKKMYDALENHPECDLCDSVLKLIDENGNEIQPYEKLYVAHHWHVPFPRNIAHIRKCPSDFFAHMGGKTIYTSVTQILIRSSLFLKTGLFPTDFGVSADYLWEMRAALYANVVFIPEKLSSWRVYKEQATFASSSQKTDENFHLMSQMAELVCKECHPLLAKSAGEIKKIISFKETLLPAKRDSALKTRLRIIARSLVKHPLYTMEFVFNAIRYSRSVPRHFLLIYAYDKMVLRRTGKFSSYREIPFQ